MITFDSKTTKLRRRFNDKTKKINKRKKLDFSQEVNIVFERKKFIDNIC